MSEPRFTIEYEGPPTFQKGKVVFIKTASDFRFMATEVRNVLAEINKTGVSILLVEHNLKIAMSLAHRVYLMGKAHIGFDGTVEELNANAEIRAKYLEV